MAVLNGLKGVKRKDVECLFINEASDVNAILAKGKAATAADRNGAINIWVDDTGRFKCEAMRYMQTVEEKDFSQMSSVTRWAKKWLNLIK